MARAVNEHTRRQADGLRQLRTSLGLTTTVIAGRLGFETSQSYELYERAKSRLPLDQVSRWAEAFGVSEAEFLQALGIRVAPPDGSLERMLTAIGMPDDEQRQLLSSLGNKPTTADERAAIVRAVTDVLRKRTTASGRSRRRA